MDYVDRTKFIELDSILWDVRTVLIPAKDAFALYERRWSYVDKSRLGHEELALIKLLTKQEGNGCFMPG